MADGVYYMEYLRNALVGKTRREYGLNTRDLCKLVRLAGTSTREMKRVDAIRFLQENPLTDRQEEYLEKIADEIEDNFDQLADAAKRKAKQLAEAERKAKQLAEAEAQAEAQASIAKFIKFASSHNGNVGCSVPIDTTLSYRGQALAQLRLRIRGIGPVDSDTIVAALNMKIDELNRLLTPAKIASIKTQLDKRDSSLRPSLSGKLMLGSPCGENSILLDYAQLAVFLAIVKKQGKVTVDRKEYNEAQLIANLAKISRQQYLS